MRPLCCRCQHHCKKEAAPAHTSIPLTNLTIHHILFCLFYFSIPTTAAKRDNGALRCVIIPKFIPPDVLRLKKDEDWRVPTFWKLERSGTLFFQAVFFISLGKIMENSSSGGASEPLSAPGVCEQDEGVLFRLDSSAEPSSDLAAFNLSLNCWLHILSREFSLDLHGDSSNLPVGLFTVLAGLDFPEPV